MASSAACRNLFWIVLVWGLVNGTSVTEDSTRDQCGCVIKHPQQKFCSLEAAFKGRALSVYTLSAAPAIRIRPLLIRDPLSDVRKRRSFILPPPQLPVQQPMIRKTMKYKFYVEEVFKGDISPESEINVDVHEDTSGCVSSFAINQTYLVTGKLDSHGTINNGVCDWSGCWYSDISRYQKISLKNRGYNCDVKICYQGTKCLGDADTCVWPGGAKERCYSTQAKCHRLARLKKAAWAIFPPGMDRCLRGIPE